MVLCAATALTVVPATAHGTRLISWAETAQAIALPGRDKPSLMTIEDHFSAAIATDGTKAETPCSGSRWVYDYAHHIAAGNDGGPEMILYIGDPPIKLPNRDLSRVATARGIRLGDTPLHVASALKVPLADVIRSSKDRQFLYLSRSVHLPGDSHVFADLEMIVFRDGRAVSIWYAHNEP